MMGEIITKTLAEIYLQQGDFQKAYEILKELSEKEPFDPDIQKKLRELSEQLGHSALSTHQSASTADDGIQSLKRWLKNIQRRRKR